MQLAPLRNDLNLTTGPSQEHGEPCWTLHDPLNNRFYQLGEAEFYILKWWHLQDSEQIIQQLSSYPHLRVDQKQLEAVADFLARNHLIRIMSAEQNRHLQKIAETQQQPKSLYHQLSQVFFFRFPLIRPQKFLAASFPLIRFLFTKWFFIAVAVLGSIGILLTLRQWPVFTGEITQALQDGQYHLFILALIFAKVIHELGHAYSSHYFGCRVPNMGVAIMVFWPVLYTETSESWKLADKRQRMLISSAGVIAELSLALLATFLWLFFPEGALRTALILLAAVTWLSTLLVNLNPFMRFDGYYLFSDLISMPNLQERAFRLARWRLREALFQFKDPMPETFAKKKRRILYSYAYITWLYRFFLYLALALLVYHFVFKLAGILLLVLELFFFIGLPIAKEVKYWWSSRQKFNMNISLLRTGFLLGLVLFLLVFPWKNYSYVPAVMQAGERTTLYLTSSGQLKEVLVKHGDEVIAGQVLMRFESPELEQKIQLLELRIQSLENAIIQAASSIEMQQNSQILQSELVALFVEKKGLLEQKRQLVVEAPFSGKVTWVMEGMQHRHWYGQNEALLNMVDFKHTEVVAYVDEWSSLNGVDELHAEFIPENPAISAFSLNRTFAETSAVETLKHLTVANEFGGGLAVLLNAENQYEPANPAYLWHYRSNEHVAVLQYEIRGVVRITVQRQSILARVWQTTLATLIRESGF